MNINWRKGQKMTKTDVLQLLRFLKGRYMFFSNLIQDCICFPWLFEENFVTLSNVRQQQQTTFSKGKSKKSENVYSFPVSENFNTEVNI